MVKAIGERPFAMPSSYNEIVSSEKDKDAAVAEQKGAAGAEEDGGQEQGGVPAFSSKV